MDPMIKLFSAHTPAPQTMGSRFFHAYTEHLSIVEMIKSPDNPMLEFTHTHDEYEFFIPHTPMPFLVSEGVMFFAEVGWVYSVQSGRSHGAKYRIADVSISDIAIRKEYFEDMMHEQGLAGKELHQVFRLSNELKIYISSFKKEFSKDQQKDTNKLKHLASLICLELIEAGTDPAADTKKGLQKYGYQKGVRHIAEFLNDNYHRDVSVDEMAAMCDFSKNHFTASFKQAFGISPYAYLSKLRISKAKILLETTDESVHDIAIKCGFKKSNTMTSLFKSATGQTPTEYRQSIQI